MDHGHSRDDLPVLRYDDLPVLLATSAQQKEIPAIYRDWSSIASQRQLRGIAIGPDGSIWIATGGGVLRWHPGMERFSRFGSEHGLPGNRVGAIAIDGVGQVWISSETEHLYYLDGEEWRRCIPFDGVRVSSIAVDNTGRLWVAASNGLYEVKNPFSAVSVGGFLGGFAARSLAVTGGSDVWLCTAVGLHHLDANGWEAPKPFPGILALARQGENLWLGTAFGLKRITLGQRQVLSASDWPRGEVTALTAGVDGVWAAIGGSVGYASGSSWRPVLDQRFATRVVGLAPAASGELWVATADSLALIGPAGMSHYHTNKPPEVISGIGKQAESFSNIVQALAVHGGALWIGTSRGLFRVGLSDARWHAFTEEDSLQDIRALVAGAKDDELWVASGRTGLRRIKGRVPLSERFAVPASLQSMAIGLDGRQLAVAGIDLGSMPDGLYQGEKGTWSIALPASELRTRGLSPSSCLQAVTQASNGRIWIGTSMGLFSWKSGIPPKRDPSLGDRDVRAVIEIGDNLICVGTTEGLFLGPSGNLALFPDWGGHSVNVLSWESKAKRLWCGTNSGLLRICCAMADWRIDEVLTASNSGLAEDQVTALALSEGESIIWVGTPGGVSRYLFCS